MIKNFSVPNPCHEKWDGMQPQNNGRYCDSCQKVVIDFTGKTNQEIIDYINANSGKRVCGTFKSTQLEKQNHFYEFQKHKQSLRFVAALLLVFGMTLFSCSNPYATKPKPPEDEKTFVTTGIMISPPNTSKTLTDSNTITTTHSKKKKCDDSKTILKEGYGSNDTTIIMGEPLEHIPKESEPIVGIICPQSMPEFIGGTQAMMKYIQENIHWTEDLDIQGTVYVNFLVKRDGSIDNVTILRGVCPSLDKEAIRLVKNMPKWKPGIDNNKPADVRMNLPLKFRPK